MTKLRTHYDNLKISRDAPDFVIRAAWKALSQKYHPDKNPGSERAARVMVIINEAYAVLSDPERRAEHDAWIEREEAWQRSAEVADEPVKPTTGGRRDDSSIPPAWRRQDEGEDEDEEVSGASGQQGLFKRVLLFPVKLLGWSFNAFPSITFFALLLGVLALGDWLTSDHSARPAPKPYQPQAASDGVSKVAGGAGEPDCRVVLRTDKDASGKEIRRKWYLYTKDGVRNYSLNLPGECAGRVSESAISSSGAHEVEAPYARPTTAPNGKPWPVRAGYVSGYPVANAKGYSDITVDNARNDADVFVKLVALDGAVAHPVRHFYISAGERFRMEKVTAGNYDLRYQDLASGRLSRSESFEVEERDTHEGVEYSTLTMTLYKVRGGDFRTYDLADSEF